MKSTIRGMIVLMVAFGVVGCDDSSGGDDSGGGSVDQTTGGMATGGMGTGGAGTGGMGTGGTGTGGTEMDAAMPSQCDTICEVSGSLACQRDRLDNCVAECMTLYELALTCAVEGPAYFDCLEQTSMADWQCDSVGQAEPGEGVCKAEDEALSACIVAMQTP